jgi:hypothetical protein
MVMIQKKMIMMMEKKRRNQGLAFRGRGIRARVDRWLYIRTSIYIILKHLTQLIRNE